jgi:hypothetical protein
VNARTVVIERAPDKTMQLSPDTPAAERTGKLDRFVVQAAPNATTKFGVKESHAHPTHYELATMENEELRDVIKAIASDPDTVAKLQPVLDAKVYSTGLTKQLKANKKKMDDVTAEERRIRENMASLKGTAGEQELSKRYAAEMNEQEDKLAALQKDRDDLTAQHDAAVKQIGEMVGSLQFDSKLPTTVQKASLEP